MNSISVSLLLGLALALTRETSAGYTHAVSSLSKRWTTPPVSSTWDYPLGYQWHASNAASNVYFYSVDLFDTSASDIAAAKSAGHYIACYFSAGSYEDWRSDASNFPASSKGNNMDGWPGEKWVDTRNAQLRSNVMTQRIALAQQKGCMAIDPDNTDGYSQGQSVTGFPMTSSDGINYIQWLCSQAHSRGLACGLKNNPDIVGNVLSMTEFVIVESCVEYSECNSYAPFINAGKPVYHVEYSESQQASASFKASACASGGNSRFSTIIKHQSLDQYREAC